MSASQNDYGGGGEGFGKRSDNNIYSAYRIKDQRALAKVHLILTHAHAYTQAHVHTSVVAVR